MGKSICLETKALIDDFHNLALIVFMQTNIPHFTYQFNNHNCPISIKFQDFDTIFNYVILV